MDVSIGDLKNFWDTQWKLRTILPNGDELSTVELPPMSPTKQWETCMFYSTGGSDVIERYPTRKAAWEAHLTLVNEMLK